jgi:hypothetical protein
MSEEIAKRLVAVLTTGWGHSPPGAVDAASLRQQQGEEPDAYQARVAEALELAARGNPQSEPLEIANLEGLVRRTADGYRPLQWFITALIAWHEGLREGRRPPVHCFINAFTFAFLKGAKNFDLILREDREAASPETRDTFKRWRDQVDALEEFERSGESLPSHSAALKPVYLAARPILARPSARDERRTLTALVLGGPSTPGQLQSELAMSPHLTQRVLEPFLSAGLVEPSPGHADRVRVTEKAMPIALFGLREAAGIDILRALGVCTGD